MWSRELSFPLRKYGGPEPLPSMISSDIDSVSLEIYLHRFETAWVQTGTEQKSWKQEGAAAEQVINGWMKKRA